MRGTTIGRPLAHSPIGRLKKKSRKKKEIIPISQDPNCEWERTLDFSFCILSKEKKKKSLQLGDDMVRCRYHWCSRRIGLKQVPPDLKGGCSSGEFGVSFFFLSFFFFSFRKKRERERERGKREEGRGKSSVTTKLLV